MGVVKKGRGRPFLVEKWYFSRLLFNSLNLFFWENPTRPKFTKFLKIAQNGRGQRVGFQSYAGLYKRVFVAYSHGVRLVKILENSKVPFDLEPKIYKLPYFRGLAPYEIVLDLLQCS